MSACRNRGLVFAGDAADAGRFNPVIHYDERQSGALEFGGQLLRNPVVESPKNRNVSR